MSGDTLRTRFGLLWSRLGAAGDPGPITDALLASYGAPERHYHSVDHLEDCLDQLDSSPPAGEARDVVEAALWFHDAICVAGASDNESRSAALAQSALSGAAVPGDVATEVARLVRLTDHVHPPSDPSGALVCDVDLSILGRGTVEFETYEGRIRAEYAAVPEHLYRPGRVRILERLLERIPLFRTQHFRTRFEAAARRNLHTSLGRLRTPPT